MSILTYYVQKLALNNFEKQKVEKPMSQIPYILAAIDEIVYILVGFYPQICLFKGDFNGSWLLKVIFTTFQQFEAIIRISLLVSNFHAFSSVCTFSQLV